MGLGDRLGRLGGASHASKGGTSGPGPYLGGISCFLPREVGLPWIPGVVGSWAPDSRPPVCDVRAPSSVLQVGVLH
jgi:hypothetical protein